jgi:predicted AAA+ superfamily ATPase
MPQKEKIQRNTLQFVQGHPANNVLLTGSARHRAIFADQGLPERLCEPGPALIEVDKADLVDLPDIVDVCAGRAEKFMVFCDDLSFEEARPATRRSSRSSTARWRRPRPTC